MMQSIAWTLIHFCWQGALIAAILAIALASLRRHAAETRYIASCAALALMVASAVGTFAYLRQSPPIPVITAAAPARTAAPIAAAIPTASGESWLPWVTTLWAVGVALLSCRWVAAWFMLRRRTLAAPAIDLPQLHALQSRLGVLRHVAVRSANWLTSPAVSGWLRPVLLVPASALSGLDRMQLEAVLAHELAHIRRHDYFWNLVQTAAETLLFYHPAVWWVSGRIRAERENCCDDVALELCGDRALYARALLRINELASPQLSLAASRGPLQSRIARILHRDSGAPALWPLAVVAVIAGAVLFSGAPRIKAQAIPPSYQKWLSEDVKYIVTPQEQERFRQLKTDAERKQFVDQFWAVRGGIAAKREHYRRIAYANELYGATSAAGWQTDRGYVYIRFGPPDTITVRDDVQDWHYQNIPGRGTADYHFVGGELHKRPQQRHEIGAHIRNVLMRWHNQLYNAVFHSGEN